MKAILALENGMIFNGNSFGATEEIVGEIVFNTGMTGYQELLTDPSYCGQVVTMTYPLIGNYGVNLIDVESINPKVRGFIVREICRTPSNWRSIQNLDDYLAEHSIPGIEGLDTRALTRIIRENGTMKCIISTDPNFILEEKMPKILGYKIDNPVMQVTGTSVQRLEGKGKKIAVLDLGMKKSIASSLVERDCDVYIFPADSTAEQILEVEPDGIMLSNGPGDPKDCHFQIETIKKLIGTKPIFGICLGHQLTALANGADTEKMKYGHRGCNHPVKDISRDRTFITSQNHGYTIVPSSLNAELMEVSHSNMNDGTIEGIQYKKQPVFTVQFHPEASPGPADTAYLFDRFMEMIDNNSKSKGGSQ